MTGHEGRAPEDHAFNSEPSLLGQTTQFSGCDQEKVAVRIWFKLQLFESVEILNLRVGR